MVFLKLDVSCVLAGSPMARCLGPKATRDLDEGQAKKQASTRCTHGVARLETSLTMMSMPRFLATPICAVVNTRRYTTRTCADLAVECTEIDADDGHGC